MERKAAAKINVGQKRAAYNGAFSYYFNVTATVTGKQQHFPLTLMPVSIVVTSNPSLAGQKENQYRPVHLYQLRQMAHVEVKYLKVCRCKHCVMITSSVFFFIK
jgi:hypothetical protein